MIAEPRAASLRTLISLDSRFQRAVNLKYDLSDAHQVAAYVPTPSAASALRALLSTALGDDHQRANVLVGPYGSGKSHLAIVLAALLSGDVECAAGLHEVMLRLRTESWDAADMAARYQAAKQRLLPVVLSGDEGDLGTALARALPRAMRRAGLEIALPSAYASAVQTVGMWQQDYPDVYARLGERVAGWKGGLGGLIAALEEHDAEAYQQFTSLYRELAAGASFQLSQDMPPAELFVATSEAIAAHGYSGIVLLYDEFGRVLETRGGEAFGREAKVLQDLAELAARTPTLHVVLIAHKALGLYGHRLPSALEQEWRKIEGRFRTLELTTDARMHYRLIGQVLQRTPTMWKAFHEQHLPLFAELLRRVVDSRLFDLLDDADLKEVIVEGAYPLHPLTVYCLPRLSQRVAQNERTLFTFLATDDEYALGAFLDQALLNGTPSLVLPDWLYDYFEGAMRADSGPGGVHSVWANVEAALAKVDADDELCVALIKTLGVLHAVGTNDRLRPTTELLAFATHPQGDAGIVAAALERLRTRKILIYRKSVGQWEFLHGSDVDFDLKVADVLRGRPPTPASLRLLLERVLPPVHYPARRYNDERGMTRFFRSLYRTVDELRGIGDWDALLRELDYADGLIVYVLAGTVDELAAAEAVARHIRHPQVLTALPATSLLAQSYLEELYALRELRSDPAFVREDPLIERELEILTEDTTEQLNLALAPLVDPRRGQRWFHGGHEVERAIHGPGQLSQLISSLCDRAFPTTPRIYNEAFNRSAPSTQQARAAEKVIDAMLAGSRGPMLGLDGRGPEIAILHSTLRATGILAERQGAWGVGRPEGQGYQPRDVPPVAGDTDGSQAAHAQLVWDAIDEYVHSAVEVDVPFDALVRRLRLPPFGLRLGVLPLLIAVGLSTHAHVLTIRRGGQPIGVLTGSLFTEICRRPDLYTLRVDLMHPSRATVLTTLARELGREETMHMGGSRAVQAIGDALVIWFKALPRFARDTMRVSREADALRRVARLAAVDATQALLHELPIVLDVGEEGEEATGQACACLRAAMQELLSASDDLAIRFEREAVRAFGGDAPTLSDALVTWRGQIEERVGPLDGWLSDDVAVDGLLTVALEATVSERDIVGRLGQLVTGIPMRDWTDATELDALRRLEAAVARARMTFSEPLAAGEEGENVAELVLRLPGEAAHVYHFRNAELSAHAQLLLNNLLHTLESTGRALPPEERRRIGLEVARAVLDSRRRRPEWQET